MGKIRSKIERAILNIFKVANFAQTLVLVPYQGLPRHVSLRTWQINRINKINRINNRLIYLCKLGPALIQINKD